ncbi:nuclear transport factor 2 family protein [Microscilla marina]|uniref:Putative dehydrogenase n=1 Tax=Microscilla marina ATCC 23134 TaxID=313606 RepID=A1ZHV1_MICM2|nr:nuclear transport factor 2 family protein [Microscilla marina]EAY30108.1 putative dehydrogenase [Microscilla marina ATCC 23134]
MMTKTCKTVTLFILGWWVLFSAPTQAQSQNKDDMELIQEVIKHYFEGGANSNIASFKKALHPKTYLKFSKNGAYTEIDMPTYYGFYKAGKVNQRVSKILSIDITDSAAAAKVSIAGKKRVFTDYFTLLKLKDGWKIVSKTSTNRPVKTNR